jgi:hypothetical protein
MFIGKFGRAADEVSSTLSRWYPLAYLGRLAALEPWRADDEFDIVDVISTFGGARPPINPTEFRLLSFQRTNGGEIIGFGPERLFEPGGYVMTYPAYGKRAELCLDIAPAVVLVTAVEADMTVPQQHRRPPLYFAPPPAPKLWPSAVFVDITGEGGTHTPVTVTVEPRVFPPTALPREMMEEEEEEEEQANEGNGLEPENKESAQIDPAAVGVGGKAVAQLEKEGSVVIIEFNGVHEFEIARLSALTVRGRILPKAAPVASG